MLAGADRCDNHVILTSMNRSYAKEFHIAMKSKAKYHFPCENNEEIARIRIAAYMFAKRHGRKAKTSKGEGGIQVYFSRKKAPLK